MTSFLIIMLKRKQPHKISSAEIVVLINLCPRAFLLAAVKLSVLRCHARLKDRLRSADQGVDTVLRLALTPASPCSPVACSFKVTSSLCEGSHPFPPKLYAGGLLRWTLLPLKLVMGVGLLPYPWDCGWASLVGWLFAGWGEFC